MSKPSLAHQGAEAASRARKRRAMPCPHCGEALRVRYSQMQSETCRQGGMECTNACCGWRGTFSTTLDATHVQSAQPRADVRIPLSRAARRRMEQALAQDDARRVRVESNEPRR